MKSESGNPKKTPQKIRVRLRMQEKSCTFARIMRLKSNVNIKNRRATFDYEVLERYTAGIQLFGTEIKSIRESKASLVDTYCQFVGNELWVKQMHIAEYRFGTYANHEAKRDRKLLMTRKELRKLEKQVKDTGKTIIPLRLFINEQGFSFPVFYDSSSTAAFFYGLQSIPATIFVDAEGYIVSRVNGLVGKEQLREGIEMILP